MKKNNHKDFIKFKDWFFSNLKEVENGCIEWQKYCDPKGYGRLRSRKVLKNYGISREIITAHRVAWVIEYGIIPIGMCVLHKCDNPKCCNPKHLFIGTNTDNTSDRHRKGRTASGDRSGSRMHPDRVPKGEQNGLSKLKWKQVIEIRKIFDAGGTTKKELAIKFSVSERLIDQIVKRQIWDENYMPGETS